MDKNEDKESLINKEFQGDDVFIKLLLVYFKYNRCFNQILKIMGI